MKSDRFIVMFSTIGVTLLFVLLVSLIHNVSAHQKQLVSINGKDYLLVVGSANEPAFVDDKSGVELFAYLPTNKSDPTSTDPNSTKPIEGLEKNLKVEVSAGSKKTGTEILIHKIKIQVIILLHSSQLFKQHIIIEYLEMLVVLR